MEQDFHINNKYQIITLLGTGGQTSVYLCKKDQELLAAKVYLSNFKKNYKRQVNILQNLKHQYVVKYLASHQDVVANLPEAGQLIFAVRTCLSQYISKTGKLPIKICKKLFNNLIKGMIYINSNKIYHRDLKPENILFDQNFNIKISDFGLSAFSYQQDQGGFFYNKLGTSGYKPLQMQLGRYKGIDSDIFAAGVILFYMYTGSTPFYSASKTDHIYKIIIKRDYDKFWNIFEKKFPEDFYPQPLKQLFNSFFSINPQQRPTYSSLKTNNWLNEDIATDEQLKDYMQKVYHQILKQDQNYQQIQNLTSANIF